MEPSVMDTRASHLKKLDSGSPTSTSRRTRHAKVHNFRISFTQTSTPVVVVRVPRAACRMDVEVVDL